MRTNVVWNLIQMQDTVTWRASGTAGGMASAAPSGCMRIYYYSFKRLPPYPDHDAGGPDGRLFLSVVPGASHQYADIAGVDETMDGIRTLADQLTG